MNIRKTAIRVVLVVIGLPVVLVLIAAAWISVLNRTNGIIISSGQKRDYLLYVPQSYDRTKPTLGATTPPRYRGGPTAA